MVFKAPATELQGQGATKDRRLVRLSGASQLPPDKAVRTAWRSTVLRVDSRATLLNEWQVSAIEFDALDDGYVSDCRYPLS